MNRVARNASIYTFNRIYLRKTISGDEPFIIENHLNKTNVWKILERVLLRRNLSSGKCLTITIGANIELIMG